MPISLAALADQHIPTITAACADWQELSTHGAPYWRPRSPAELARKIAVTAGPAVASEYNFVVQQGDRLVGECSLHAIDWRNRVAQVGICIWNPADRGNGAGRDAVCQLIAWADGHLDLQRLEAWVLAGNQPSQQLFTSLGFTHEGILRGRYIQAGRRHDIYILGRLKTESATPPDLSPAAAVDPR